MAEKFPIPSDASSQQVEMIVGALYLSLAHTLAHIDKIEDATSAGTFKREFITALQSGDIDMSILDDASTFDFVVPMIARLVEVKT